ncbi:MAG: hypothetical protein DMF51_04120, partial [Acidobacteria bacterium]
QRRRLGRRGHRERYFLNGDGWADVVTANATSDDVSVLLSRGDGTVESEIRYAAGNAPVAVALADLNADGLKDIVVVNRDSFDLSVFLGLRGGGFGPQMRFPCGGNSNPPLSISIRDMNGDGRPDLVVANQGYIPGPPGFVSVLLGAGDGTFGPPSTFGAGSAPQVVATGDFNNDGRPDIVAADLGAQVISSPDVLILLGIGDGTFTPALGTGSGAEPRGIVVGDFDADGRQDLALVRTFRSNPPTSYVSVMLGNGDGTFAPEVRYPAGLGGQSIIAVDLDSDLRSPDPVRDKLAPLLGRRGRSQR